MQDKSSKGLVGTGRSRVAAAALNLSCYRTHKYPTTFANAAHVKPNSDSETISDSRQFFFCRHVTLHNSAKEKEDVAICSGVEKCT